MSLLSYEKLKMLVRRSVISNITEDMINAASIDLTLGRYLQIESNPLEIENKGIVHLKRKDTISVIEIDLLLDPHHMLPGSFLLAQTEQVFNLPDNIAAEYKLKSSLARSGLNHALAGWCDPGWNGSVLTLELKNTTNNHVLVLEQGMKIGQIIFYEVEKVPNYASYKVMGRYNQDKKVTASRGLV